MNHLHTPRLLINLCMGIFDETVSMTVGVYFWLSFFSIKIPMTILMNYVNAMKYLIRYRIIKETHSNLSKGINVNKDRVRFSDEPLGQSLALERRDGMHQSDQKSGFSLFEKTLKDDEIEQK